MGNDHLVALLKSSEVFADLDDADYQLLSEKAKDRQFMADEIIFLEGDVGGALYLVESGDVSIESTTESEEGYETVIYVIRGTGDVIGEFALFDELTRSATARTVTPAKIWRLRGQDVMDCLEESPELAQNVIRYLCKKLRQATKRHEGFSHTVRVRLLRELRNILAKSSEPVLAEGKVIGHKPRQKLNQELLASLVLCRREVISRTLKELEHLGEIERHRSDVILRERLRRVVAAELLLAEMRADGFVATSTEFPARIGTTPAHWATLNDGFANAGIVESRADGIQITDVPALRKIAEGDQRL